MKLFLLILLLGTGLFAVWDLYLAEHPLPARTILTDRDGNSAEVEILSATADSVRLRVTSNGMVYDWPMSKLGIISRYKAFRLIQSSKKAEAEKRSNHPMAIQRAKQTERTSVYIQNYERNIEENNKRIAELNNRLNEARSRRVSQESPPTASERALMQQIDRLRTENNVHMRNIQEAMNNGR